MFTMSSVNLPSVGERAPESLSSLRDRRQGKTLSFPPPATVRAGGASGGFGGGWRLLTLTATA